jgi:hypothetical protein
MTPVDPVATALRDLRWAISSPVLCGTLPPLFADWAQAREAIEVGEETASRRHSPIGRYFEALIVGWLAAQEGVSKLEANLPVRRGSSTLGEVDLLFEVDGKAYHWELALKFYLGTGDRRQACQWFGPLARDRLDRKLDKLKSQLQLLDTPEGKALLQEREIASVESHALIKGYLFHPYEHWQRQRTVPPEVSKAHAHGWWIHASDFEQICDRSQHWIVLSKPDWLAPARSDDPIDSAQLSARLQRYFAVDDRPPMLAALDDKGQEIERGFVVPDDWSAEVRGRRA